MMLFFKTFLFLTFIALSFTAQANTYTSQTNRLPIRHKYPQKTSSSSINLSQSQISYLRSCGISIETIKDIEALEALLKLSPDDVDGSIGLLDSYTPKSSHEITPDTSSHTDSHATNLLERDDSESNFLESQERQSSPNLLRHKHEARQLDSGAGYIAIFPCVFVVGFFAMSVGFCMDQRQQRRRERLRQAAIAQRALANQGVLADGTSIRYVVYAPDAAVGADGRQEIGVPFPKAEFNTINNSFKQTACSICLDEFSTNVLCTQLLCGHIFHPECIKEWLVQHETCPNCNLKMPKEMIAAYLIAPMDMNDIRIEGVQQEPINQDANMIIDVQGGEQEPINRDFPPIGSIVSVDHVLINHELHGDDRNYEIEQGSSHSGSIELNIAENSEPRYGNHEAQQAPVVSIHV